MLESPDCLFCLKEIKLGLKEILIPCCYLFHKICGLNFLNLKNKCFVCNYELHDDDIEIEDITNFDFI